MNKMYVALVSCTAFAAGILAARLPQLHPADAASTTPTTGWNLHIDAEQHFGQHPKEIAHHWCKAVSNGLTECQIYNSDAPDAQLVAVETIVGPDTYKSFPAGERAMWHWHRTEIPKVNATMPDLSPEEAKKTAEAIAPTYGKIYLLFDPLLTNDQPTGQPMVTVLK